MYLLLYAISFINVNKYSPENFNDFADWDGCPDVETDDKSSKESQQNNSILQWTAVIAACISAGGGIAAAKYRKH